MSVRKRLLALCATSAVLLSMVVGTASPSAAATVPDAPTNVTATPGDTSAVVSWLAPMSDGGSAVTGYTVTLQPGDESCSTTVGVTPNPLTCTVNSLTNSTEYSVYIVATNVIGDSLGGAPAVSYSVGSAGPGGGLIFYDAGSQRSWGRYLEAAPPGWGGAGYFGGGDPALYDLCDQTSTLVGASGTAIGTGAANTAKFVTACSSGVVRTATDYRGGGKSDWIVPSLAEAQAMWQQRDALGSVLVPCGYWTSSETSATNVSDVLFGDASSPAVRDVPKSALDCIRPIRYVDGVTPLATVTTSVASTVPDPPTDVSASANRQSLVVSWLAPSNYGGSPVTGYTVLLSPGGRSCSTNVATDVNALTCSIDNLAKGTMYSAKVAAVNKVGVGAYSTPIIDSANLELGGCCGDAGTVTRGMEITITVGGIYSFVDPDQRGSNTKFSFGPDGGNCPNWRYRDYDYGFQDASFEYAGFPCFSVVATIGEGAPFLVGSELSFLAPATGNLWLSVNGCNECYIQSSSGGYSAVVKIVRGVKIGDSPTPPLNVKTSTGAYGMVFVNWDAPSDDNGFSVTSYSVRHTPSDGTCIRGALEALCYGLTPGVSYNFDVIATNSIGPSQPSNSAIATPNSYDAIDFINTKVTPSKVPTGKHTVVTVSVAYVWSDGKPRSDFTFSTGTNFFHDVIQLQSKKTGVWKPIATLRPNRLGDISYSMTPSQTQLLRISTSTVHGIPFKVTVNTPTQTYRVATFRSSRSSAPKGETVTFTAALRRLWTDAKWHAAYPVQAQLQSNASGSWKTIVTRGTNRAGNVSLTATVRRTQSYRVAVGGVHSVPIRVKALPVPPPPPPTPCSPGAHWYVSGGDTINGLRVFNPGCSSVSIRAYGAVYCQNFVLGYDPLDSGHWEIYKAISGWPASQGIGYRIPSMGSVSITPGPFDTNGGTVCASYARNYGYLNYRTVFQSAPTIY